MTVTVSNEQVVAKKPQGVTTDRGSWNKLNPEVKEIIGTRPSLGTHAPDANTSRLPDCSMRIPERIWST
ncbi:TPR repeat region-containing protein [Nocardia sp. Marseille-Q1738]